MCMKVRTHRKNCWWIFVVQSVSNTPYLEAVVANDTKERDDGVDNTEESQGRLHVACALFQEVIHGTLFVIIFTAII